MYDENNNMNFDPSYTPAKPKKGLSGAKLVALLLVAAILGGTVGAGGTVFMLDKMNPRGESMLLQGERPLSSLDIGTIDTSKLLSPSEVYAQNVKSTVGITTSITTNYFGFTSTSAASGSGFVFTESGYILTNHHVIEGSDSIKVSMYDGESYDAQLIGYDKSNDIAVLKIEAEGLVPVVLGDSDSLVVGETVVAIGNPLGELTFSLTSGVVSALDRQVTLSANVTMDLIQTDCAINSGNSGGALFNLYGEVIGITNAKYSSSSSGASIDNIGFAIPVNNILDIVTSIIEKGYIAKPYIGVTVSTVSTDAQRYGLPAGATVESVIEDGPAAKAGLQVSDIITAAGGTAISSSGELVDYVGDLTKGAQLTLSVYRQGETLELTLTVGEQTSSALAEEQNQSQQQSLQPQQPGSNGPSIFDFFNFGF